MIFLRRVMPMGLLIASIIPGPSPLRAQNPPTAYTPYSTPYDGTESWYCERVSAVSNGRCRFSDVVASLTTLANLTSAPALTTTGTITTGGAAGPGFNLNLGTIGYTGTLPNAQLSFTFPLAIANGGTGTTTPSLTAGAGITISGSWPNLTISKTAPTTTTKTPSNPTLSTNVAQRMGGLKGTITPTATGTVYFTIQGTTSTASECNMQIRYGSGVGPNNAAAATGTVIGTAAAYNDGTGEYALITLGGVVSGLSLSTAYWFDYSTALISGTNCGMLNISMYAVEL
jgi:hypothetical protein